MSAGQVTIANMSYRITSNEGPPPIIPEPVSEHFHVHGEQVIISSPNGVWKRGYRAVSNPYRTSDGQTLIRVVPEAEWWHYAITGTFSDGTKDGKIITLPTSQVWVEVARGIFSIPSALI